jgi:hypothetical protein
MPHFFEIIWAIFAIFCLFLLVGCRPNFSESWVMPTQPTPILVITFPSFPTALPSYSLVQTPLETHPPLWQSVPQTLRIEPPDCYAQPNGTLLCLGRVQNVGKSSLKDLNLSATTGRETRTLALAQRTIPANSYAPYHFILAFGTRNRPQISVEHFSLAQNGVEINSQTLLELTQNIRYVREERGYGEFVGEVQLTNNSPYQLLESQVIVSVLDEEQHLVAYRVHELSTTLLSQQSTSFEIRLIPQTVVESYQIEVYAEALSWND